MLTSAVCYRVSKILLCKVEKGYIFATSAVCYRVSKILLCKVEKGYIFANQCSLLQGVKDLTV